MGRRWMFSGQRGAMGLRFGLEGGRIQVREMRSEEIHLRFFSIHWTA